MKEDRIPAIVVLLAIISLAVACRSTNRLIIKKEENMFTVQQIEAAHSKVKSGADFPAYIREIKSMGVTAFETWVKDSHTEYSGADGYRTASMPMYKELSINSKTDKAGFEHCLKMHQRGETDYITFCRHCAETGIEKWFVSLEKMTCTYYDRSGAEILIEQIPQ